MDIYIKSDAHMFTVYERYTRAYKQTQNRFFFKNTKLGGSGHFDLTILIFFR